MRLFALLLRFLCVPFALFMRSTSAVVRRCQPMCVGFDCALASIKVGTKIYRRTERTECINVCVPCQSCAFCVSFLSVVCVLHQFSIRQMSVTRQLLYVRHALMFFIFFCLSLNAQPIQFPLNCMGAKISNRNCELLLDQWTELLQTWWKYRCYPGECIDIFGDLRSKVNVTRGQKVNNGIHPCYAQLEVSRSVSFFSEMHKL